MAANRSILKDRRYAQLREFKGTTMDMAHLRSLGAHSVGIGRKIENGKATNTLALRVYVSRKQPASKLSAETLIPPRIRHHSRLADKAIDIVTDVIEVPPPVFEPIDPTDRFRPAPGGVSLGIPSVSAGTLGGWVWDLDDDTIVMLSNDHVIGDDPGIGILQPGIADGGTLANDRIGTTKRRVPRSTTVTNDVDCAIGDVDDTMDHDLRVEEIGPAVYAIAVAEIDMAVEKYGRTTEHTFGEVEDVDYSTTIGGRPFDDCIYVDVVSPSADWSAGGDSGSLVFSREPIEEDSEIKPAVGLHFAGGIGATYGIECKIQNVFSRLNLTTLCSGAFAAFIEALFDEGAESEARDERLAALTSLATRRARTLPRFLTSARERGFAAGGRFHAGIARDVQSRLQLSSRGRRLTEFVDRHRSPLLNLLTRDRDLQRATTKTLRPLLVGATTTDDVLERVLTDKDVTALKALAAEVARRGDKRVAQAVKPLTMLIDRAEGKNVAGLLRLKR